MATYFVDGAAGSDSNDGRSPATARRTLASHLPLQSVTILLKRGTTVSMPGGLYPTNLVLDAYGTGGRPVVQAAGSTAGIVPTAGEIVVRNIRFVGVPQDMATGSAVGGGKASRVVVEDSEFDYFANAVTFSGRDGVIQRNRISNVSNNGLYGGKNGYPAPSNYLISDNTIDATGAANDAITLHDGDGIGEGNRIVGNRLWGASENAVDVLGQYRATVIQGNTIGATGLSGVIVSRLSGSASGGENTVIADNIFTGSSYTAIYSRVNGATIARNRISNVVSARNATAIAVSGRADIVDNVITVPSNTLRPVINLMEPDNLPAPTGSITGNVIENASAQQVLGLLTPNYTAEQVLAGWTIDRNHYRVPNVSLRWFVGLDISTWRNRNWGGPQPFKDLSTVFQAVSN